MPQRRTAKQRAALRKAQIASARKRRRRRNIAIAGTALAVGVGAGIGLNYAGKRYARHLARAPKPGMTRGPRATVMTKPMLALPPGKSARPPTAAQQKRKATKAAKIKVARTGARHRIESHKGIFKVDQKGNTSYLRRSRPHYDAARRAAYKPRPRPKKYKPRSK